MAEGTDAQRSEGARGKNGVGWIRNRGSTRPTATTRRPDADLDVLVSWAQSRFGDDAGLERLRPDHGSPLPAAGERHEWIARQIAAAFAVPGTRRIYALEGALERVVMARLREPGRLSALIESGDNIHHRNEAEALAIAARHAALARGGVAAMRRIHVEAERLAETPDATIVRRLAHTPAVRLDAIPADPPRRRQWLREALTGEAAAIAGGAMSPERVAHAAVASMAPVRHDRPADGSPIRVAIPAWSTHTDPTRQLDARAARLSQQSDAQLAMRFGRVPGGDGPPMDAAERQRWTRRALEAEIVRPMAGLCGEGPRPLRIELQSITTGDPADGFHFGGTLVVDGERICRITSPGDGVIEADQWSHGCSPADTEALDLHIAVTGAPRDGGETPDSLAATLIDQVAMHVAIAAYREASAEAVLFHLEGGDPAMLMVKVPEGGTREGARLAMLDRHPDAVCLDMMGEAEAAMVWMTFAD